MFAEYVRRARSAYLDLPARLALVRSVWYQAGAAGGNVREREAWKARRCGC
jgi:hypothetical protein